MEPRTAAAIAANRYGLGAKAGELARIAADPQGWLRTQLDGGPPMLADAGLTRSAEIIAETLETRGEARPARRNATPGRQARPAPGEPTDPRAGSTRDSAAVRNVVDIARRHRSIYDAEVEARTRHALATDRPFVERLTHFWTNHFAVSVDKPAMLGLAGAFEREAIRPNVLGNFSDLLIAAERHPAMLIYLDNHLSIGPGSRIARAAAARRNARELGLNENLAREILELHTLGVGGGYSQRDVTSLAEVLTGWSIVGAGQIARRLGATQDAVGEPGEFAFRAQLHEPGAKEVLGKRYADAGVSQGEAVLRDLAAAPATARFVATKLARHFIADEPPDSAVDRIAQAFLASDGDLIGAYHALVEAPEAWQAPLAKYKTPSDYVISALRGLAVPPGRRGAEAASFELLGQRTYSPGSPAGWPDRSADWDGGSALLKRIEWADALSQRIGARRVAAELAPQLLGGTLSPATAAAIERAATAEQAVTLLLTAPEFVRR